TVSTFCGSGAPRPPRATPFPYTTLFRSRSVTVWFGAWQTWADREDTVVVTIAQLRAVLAILRVDPSGSEGVHRGPADEQADLVSLLHRVISGELQQLAAAATAPAPAPALLDAAAHSAHATAALLALSRRPEGAAAEDRWQGALYDLGTAYHLLNDE